MLGYSCAFVYFCRRNIILVVVISLFLYKTVPTWSTASMTLFGFVCSTGRPYKNIEKKIKDFVVTVLLSYIWANKLCNAYSKLVDTHWRTYGLIWYLLVKPEVEGWPCTTSLRVALKRNWLLQRCCGWHCTRPHRESCRSEAITGVCGVVLHHTS